MALFGKKNAAAEAAEDSAQVSSQGKSSKKKASGMSQILHESVLETALDHFKENDAFIRYEHGEQKYVGLVLDTADIGGLDKKSRKDEAKGSIIECINSGRIQTYINQDLMDAECICIIPDAGTLTAMDEFSLLTDAPYEFCQVDETGDIELLGVKTTFSQVSDLVADDGHIDDILGDSDEEDANDDDDFFDSEIPTSQSDTSGSSNTGVPVEDVPSDVEDDIPEADDIPEDTDDVGSVDAWTAASAGLEDEAPAEDAYDPYAAAMAADDIPEQTIPADFSDQVVVRKFYSEDLGLEVTSEPFDAQFMQSNPYIPFEEHRGPGWINDQLNEMSRAANVELARLHSENQWQMRERYFKLVSMSCERIREALDIHDPDTQYGKMYAQIESDKRAAMDGIDRRVMKRKEEIEANWRQRLQEVGMEAARAAQHQYRERYGRAHDIEIYNIEAAEKANIEDEYQDNLHDMYERRRIEAASLLDLNITEILDEISDMYLTSLTDERQRYSELDADMRKFVDDNRQDDMARSAVLAEELRQSERADKVLAEQTAKMQALSEEYRQKREGLLEDIQTLKRENAERLAAMKEDNEHNMERAANERKALEQKYDELLEKYKSLDAQKDKEYQARFEELRDQNDALADRNDNLMEVHRRSNLVSTFLIIAIAIATLAIGFIGGEYINTQNRTKMEQQSILDEFKAEQNKTVEPSGSEAVPETQANESSVVPAVEASGSEAVQNEEASVVDEVENIDEENTEAEADTEADANAENQN